MTWHDNAITIVSATMYSPPVPSITYELCSPTLHRPHLQRRRDSAAEKKKDKFIAPCTTVADRAYSDHGLRALSPHPLVIPSSGCASVTRVQLHKLYPHAHPMMVTHPKEKKTWCVCRLSSYLSSDMTHQLITQMCGVLTTTEALECGEYNAFRLSLCPLTLALPKCCRLCVYSPILCVGLCAVACAGAWFVAGTAGKRFCLCTAGV